MGIIFIFLGQSIGLFLNNDILCVLTYFMFILLWSYCDSCEKKYFSGKYEFSARKVTYTRTNFFVTERQGGDNLVGSLGNFRTH